MELITILSHCHDFRGFVLSAESSSSASVDSLRHRNVIWRRVWAPEFVDAEAPTILGTCSFAANAPRLATFTERARLLEGCGFQYSILRCRRPSENRESTASPLSPAMKARATPAIERAGILVGNEIAIL